MTSDLPALPPDLAAAIALGGEMGRLVAEFDWQSHPLGAPQSWSADVRAAVALALTTRFPTMLWLGTEDLFQIYNDAYLPILGDKHLDALGRRAAHTWWDIWASISPMLVSVIATGEATLSHDLMLPIVTGGRRLERYFTFTYSPLIDERGKTYGVFCSSFETTERVLSERRMQLLHAVASVALETNAIDHVAEATIAVCEAQAADVPVVAAYVNDGAALTLRAATPSVAALLPATLDQLTDWAPSTQSRAELQVIDNVAARISGIADKLGNDCPDQALLLPLGDGPTAGALLIGTNPRCALDDHYIGFCQLLADQLASAMAAAVSYDQQRQRADALTDLDRAKTAFLTNVSHEFRTPLTLLMGPLEHAIATNSTDVALIDELTTARRNAGRLQRLVDTLLDFSRIEAGRATATLLCTDVGALTAHIAASFSELCQRAGLDLKVDCQAAPADIDPGMWETIVLNLLSNAVKYTLTGSITLTVDSDATLCHIRIRDTGVGISPGDLERLGERFFRVDSAHGRSVEGTGIGLSLVGGLVELQHGTVDYTSEVARGTTVSIGLPRSQGTPVSHSSTALLDNPYVVEAGQWVTAAPAPLQHAVASGGRELVLIADDNADMRAHLQRVLSPQWQTVAVNDGQEGIDAARRLRPDLIVTDVMMPRMDGFELVAAIRADPDLATTPVLMLSARAGADAVSEGFAGGADDYLPKPFSPQELIDRVAARLSAAARERARRSPSDAMKQALDFAQLEAALQAATSAAALTDALQGCSFGAEDAPLICLGALDAEARIVRFEYGDPVPPEMRDRYHVASLDTPIVAVDVINSGQPMIIADTRALNPRYEHVVRETAEVVRSCISQPLRAADGQIIGSLGMGWPTPREFSPAEIDWAAQVADITQSALDGIRQVQRNHRIAVDFQEHLLDLDHSSTAAVVAAVYEPGGEALRVGGDWYLAAPLAREGQVAISVGDVVGHGLPAAVAMSRLRTAAAAIALTHTDPGAVLATLDRYVATTADTRFATVSYAVIDTGAANEPARLTYSCAGHPYPLLLTPGQPPEFLYKGRRPPVGASDTPLQPRTAVHTMRPGCVMVLYTDGLIERPGESLDEGFARLKSAATERAHLPVGELCDALLDAMAPPGGYTDDVVVLAVRPCHSAPRSFATVIPASQSRIADTRHLLRDWLSQVGVDPARESDILHATGEVLTNAIEHGCGGDDSKTVSMEAVVRGHTITATISDPGRWAGDSSASQRGQHRGRGLTMINSMASHVTTDRGRGGTRVTLNFERAITPTPGVTP